MKVVTLTGGTRGIGYGLADSFLALGCSVTISGRDRKNVDEAAATLAAKHGAKLFRQVGQDGCHEISTERRCAAIAPQAPVQAIVFEQEGDEVVAGRFVLGAAALEAVDDR